uniref:RNA-directed DNA polymerase n=1 Tax=Fagus sylvatica TaxID=28930 RepID=A0A2N9H7S0_FAGSY
MLTRLEECGLVEGSQFRDLGGPWITVIKSAGRLNDGFMGAKTHVISSTENPCLKLRRSKLRRFKSDSTEKQREARPKTVLWISYRVPLALGPRLWASRLSFGFGLPRSQYQSPCRDRPRHATWHCYKNTPHISGDSTGESRLTLPRRKKQSSRAMPPKPRQRRKQREVSAHMEHSQAESAVNVQGQDQPQPPPSNHNQEKPSNSSKERMLAQRLLLKTKMETRKKPHEDSGSHQKEATFVTMSDVADLLKQEREKNQSKGASALFVRKPPYPAELLKQPYPEKYVAPTFSRFDGRKGSALVHIKPTHGTPLACRICEGLGRYGSVLRKVWEDLHIPSKVDLLFIVFADCYANMKIFSGGLRKRKLFRALVNLHTTKQANGEDLLRYIHRFRDISLDCYANYEEGELVGLLQKARKTALSVKPHTEKPREKKNPPQVLTVSTVNSKRRKSNERSFDEAPPPVPSDCWTLRRKFHEKIQDGTLELPQVQQKVHTDPFPKHKSGAVVSVVIHGSTSDVNADESATASTAMTPTAIKTLQRNPSRFWSSLHCFTAETHASRAFLETTNAVTFTDEDMEVQYPDHRRPLYLAATINEVQVRRALVDNGSCINLIPLSTIQAAEIPQKKIQGAPMEIKGFGGVGEYTKGHIQLVLKVGPIVAFTRFHVVDSVVPYHVLLGRPWLHKHQLIPSTYHQCVKGRLNGKPIRIAANSAPFDQSESHFVEAALYDEITPAGEASLAKPIGIPLPKVGRNKGRPWGRFERSAGTEKEACAGANCPQQEAPEPEEGILQPSCLAVNEASAPEPADAAEPVAADSKISAEEELEEYQDVFAWQYDEMPGIDPKLVAHSLNVEPGTRPVVQPMRTFHPEVEAQITQEVKKLLSAGFIKPIQHPRWLSNIVPVKKKNGQIRCCVDFRNLNKACPKDEFPLPNMDLLIDSAAGHAMDAEKTAFRTPIGNFYYTVMPFGLKNAGATYQRTMTAMFHDMMHREIEDYVDDIVVKSKTRRDHFGVLKKVFERCRLYKLKMNPLKCAFGVSAGKFLGFLSTSACNFCFLTTLEEGSIIPLVYRMPRSLRKGTKHHDQTPYRFVHLFLENLFRLYLASNSQAIGALIAQEDGNGVEQPIYYVSRTLKDAESRYSGAERSCLALIYASQKLRHYFLAHKVQLMTKSHPIRSLLHRQAIADLLAQFPGEDNSLITDEVPGEINEGPGIVLYKDDGEAVTKSFKFDFPCSNNAAEYEAYLAGLAIAYEMGIKHLRVIGDSNLGGNENRYADALATLGSQMAFEGEEMDVTICKKAKPITESLRKEFEELSQDQEDWRAPIKAKLVSPADTADLREIKDYTLISGDLYRRLPGGVLARCISLEEAKERLPKIHETTCGDGGAVSLYRRLQRLGYFWPSMSAEAAEIQNQCPTCQFHSQQRRGGTLFRKGFHGEPLRCLSLSESQMVMKETHAGECGEHQGKKRLYQCLLTLGYYWPTMKKDAADFVKTCHTCQVQANLIHTHPTSLQNMATPWPFHTWGLDLIGPINPASGGCIWILVATEYFTKWVEAIPLRKATDVREVLEHYRVKHRRSTPYYPQGNGQAEATNRMLLRILSKMVFDYGNDWKAHLADVLWAYRSSPKTATGFTPFSLVYARMADLEGLDEARDLAKAKAQRNYQKMANAAEFVRRNLPSPSKFSPNWDGPYIIREAHGSGYYRLSKPDGTTLADPINGKWLKHYYS